MDDIVDTEYMRKWMRQGPVAPPLANPIGNWTYVQLAGFCRQFRKSSNSPFLAPSRNASNSGSV